MTLFEVKVIISYNVDDGVTKTPFSICGKFKDTHL